MSANADLPLEEDQAEQRALAEEAANAAVNSQTAMQGAAARHLPPQDPTDHATSQKRPLPPAAEPHKFEHETSSDSSDEEDEEKPQKKKRKKSAYHPIQAVGTLAPIILSRNGPPGVDPPKQAGVYLRNLIWPHFTESNKQHLQDKLIANRATVSRFNIKGIYNQQPEEVRVSIDQLFWRAYLKSKSAVPPNQQDAAQPNSPSNKQPAGKGRGAKKAASANTPVPAQGPRQTRQQQQPMEPEQSGMQKASRVLTEATSELQRKKKQLESAAKALSLAEANHAAEKAAFLMSAYQ